MLQIEIQTTPEGWDEEKQEFIEPKTVSLQLEHSLLSLSKWESKWCRSFFSKKEKSFEESIDYIKCMTITRNVDPSVYGYLTKDNIDEIYNYINAPMSATYFSEDAHGGKGKLGGETITSELVYYWMVALNIPFTCEKWHLNRLINLIRVCNIKNQPPKKMSKRDVMSRNAALNAARRQKLNTRG